MKSQNDIKNCLFKSQTKPHKGDANECRVIAPLPVNQAL